MIFIVAHAHAKLPVGTPQHEVRRRLLNTVAGESLILHIDIFEHQALKSTVVGFF
jgi:hypothetical protein